MQRAGGRIITPLIGEQARTIQRFRPPGPRGHPPLARGRMPQRPHAPPATFREMAAHFPELPEPPTQAQPRLGAAWIRRAPFEGRPQVVVLGLQPSKPFLLLGPRQVRWRLLRQAEKEVPVSAPPDRRLTAFQEPVPGILSHRL